VRGSRFGRAWSAWAVSDPSSRAFRDGCRGSDRRRVRGRSHCGRVGGGGMRAAPMTYRIPAIPGRRLVVVRAGVPSRAKPGDTGAKHVR